MLVYPDFDPVAISLGPLQVRWYGLMYLFGFLAIWVVSAKRCAAAAAALNRQQFADFLFYAAVGVVIGGRLGYSLFYQPGYYLYRPFEILAIWQGGMSFHGGLLGVLVASWWFSRHIERRFFEVTDFIAPLVPLGLALGRIGNFINGELWGRRTDMPWGMVFPGAGVYPRHPSQLYQSALEGVLLFVLLWWFSEKPRPRMAVSGLFLLGYGLARNAGEWFREPDAHLGFIAWNWLTMGELLSLPMVILGALLLVLAYRKPRAAPP